MNRSELSKKFKYGAHLSLSSVESVEEMIRGCGLSAMQIFISNPRSFNPVFSEKSSGNLAALKERNPGLVLCVHMPYVVNLASADASLRATSVEHVSEAIRVSSEFGAVCYVAHPGSGPYENLLDSVEKVLSETAGAGVELLVENMEGSGSKLLGNMEQISDFVSRFAGRAGLCWDTAHAHGAGIDTVSMPSAVRRAVKLVHLNDSKVEFASHKDRHDAFFSGTIGTAGIKRIIEFFGPGMTYIVEREGYDATCRDIVFIRDTLLFVAAVVTKPVTKKLHTGAGRKSAK